MKICFSSAFWELHDNIANYRKYLREEVSMHLPVCYVYISIKQLIMSASTR